MTAVFTGKWGLSIPLQFDVYEHSDQTLGKVSKFRKEPVRSAIRAKTQSPRRPINGASALSRRARENNLKESPAANFDSTANYVAQYASRLHEVAYDDSYPGYSSRVVSRVIRPTTSIETEIVKKQHQPQARVSTHQPASLSKLSLASSINYEFVQPMGDEKPSQVDSIDKRHKSSGVRAENLPTTSTALRRIVGLRRLEAAKSPSRPSPSALSCGTVSRLPSVHLSEQPNANSGSAAHISLFSHSTLEQWEFTTRPEIDKRYVISCNFRHYTKIGF